MKSKKKRQNLHHRRVFSCFLLDNSYVVPKYICYICEHEITEKCRKQHTTNHENMAKFNRKCYHGNVWCLGGTKCDHICHPPNMGVYALIMTMSDGHCSNLIGF